jgi:hypothetical protein
MLIASIDWFLDASTLLLEPVLSSNSAQTRREKTA